jgi:hypothetical protein
MNPEQIQNLKKSPDFNAFVALLVAELKKLDSLQNLSAIPRGERDVVMEGRLWASEYLAKLLSPILDGVETTDGFDPGEFAV